MYSTMLGMVEHDFVKELEVRVCVCVQVLDINPSGISDTARVGTHCSVAGRTGPPDC